MAEGRDREIAKYGGSTIMERTQMPGFRSGQMNIFIRVTDEYAAPVGHPDPPVPAFWIYASVFLASASLGAAFGKVIEAIAFPAIIAGSPVNGIPLRPAPHVRCPPPAGRTICAHVDNGAALFHDPLPLRFTASESTHSPTGRLGLYNGSVQYSNQICQF